MNNRIRSKYIKELLDDKETIKAQMNETTKETLKDYLGETVKATLDNLISESEEDDDSYDEEEATTDEILDTLEEPEDSTEDTEVDIEKSEDEDGEDETDVDVEDDIESDLDSELDNSELDDDSIWDEIEQYKDEETGEYDLTGMDNDLVIRVLKAMNPETDGVRVIKGDDDIEIDGEDDDINIEDEDGDDSIEIELDGDDELDEGEINLDYTDNYQSATAMTTPSNNEVASKKDTYSMDAGVPEGTEKPWAGKAGDMSPFSQKVDEECEFELQLDDDDVNDAFGSDPIIDYEEEHDEYPEYGDDRAFNAYLGDDEDEIEEAATTIGHNNAAVRGTTISQMPDADKPARNGRRNGVQVKGTGESPINESVKKKINALIKENKELKSIIGVLKQKVNEAILVNYNLGKVTKLFTENTTTRDEKINIIKRFDKVKNQSEAKNLYESIEKELKISKPIQKKNDGVMHLAESKTNLKETKLYESADMQETLDLMKRIDKLGKR